jgi:AraC-like DNA-binding protein
MCMAQLVKVVMKGPGLSHLWRCDPVFHKKGSQLCTKATSIYFPPNYIQHITDDESSIALNATLLDHAARGMRLFGHTRDQAIHAIQEIRAQKGLQQLGTFLQLIDLLTRTREFEPLASIGYKSSTNEKDMDRFNEVYQFLLNNFRRDITLEEVADICNISSGAFCKFFKHKTQKTFTRFLNEIRIGHACRLLQNEALSIKNICYECGYNNPVNFFCSFKAITKTTPNKYREHLKG